MEDLSIDNLSINIEKQENTINMVWQGKSDKRDPAEDLDPYLNQILEEVSGENFKIDFRKLAFMNSSSFMPVIHFIQGLNEKKLAVEIFYLQNSWQRVSFTAITNLFQDDNNITVVGKTDLN